MRKEWPLVAFTIAGQMAVGIFLLAGVPLFMSAGAHMDVSARRTWLAVLAIIFGLMALATVLSFFHLHHLFRARRVLANFRNSWLSREIFFELGFMVLVALGTFMTRTGPTNGGLLNGVVIAAGIAAILFILSMIRLYMLDTLPFWNRAYTPLSFMLTTLSLGTMTAAIIRGGGAGEPGRPASFVILSLFFVAADVVVTFLIAPGHGLLGHRSGPSLRPPAEAPRALHPVRMALTLAGLGLLGAAMIWGRGPAAEGLSGKGLLVAAFALVLAGQVAGRFLFYGLFTRPGRRASFFF